MSASKTTENFWQVWRNFKWPDPLPIEYRLYYHEDGSPKMYTMEDLPGDYVLVPQEIYVTAAWNVRVRQGQLHILPPKKHLDKLMPDQDPGTWCHARDVSIVINNSVGGRRWSLVQNEVD